MKIRLFHWAHLARRPLTLGVRALAFDPTGRVFLVRHTYLPGWHLAGGGVDAGETTETAVARELMEEGGVSLDARPALVSVHFNRAASQRDHVLVYLCRDVRQAAPKAPDLEIADSGFFALDALPTGTTPATLRRIAEHRGDAPVDPHW
ncbi:DNA mismatch repair protein MutT [Aureimonas sp. Leaf454]|nr:DNA mismatch repair protein MutT [Aureimonas sp. Leaf454]